MHIRSLSLFLAMLSVPATAFCQYKMDAAGDAVPSEVPAAIGAALQGPGIKVLNGSGQVWCEVWFVKAAPKGPASTESDVTLPTIPVGALLGAVRFPAKGLDRRDQAIQPGVYLLRYVLMPVNGAHLGAAPQRDFAAMVPAASDPGLSAKPSLQDVIAMSTKVSQTTHPAILSLAPGSGKAGLTKEAEHDWTLNTKVGDTPVSIIVAGKAEN